MKFLYKKNFVWLCITLAISFYQGFSQCFGPVSFPTSQALRYEFQNTTVDGSGFANSAVLIGTPLPTYVTDRYSQLSSAISISGVSQSVSNLNLVAGISDFSLSIWIKTNATLGGWIVGRQNGGSNDRKIFMNDNGRVRFGIWNGAIQTISSLSSLNDNNWHHIVATHATAGSGLISLYVDNVLQASSVTKSSDGSTGNWVLGNGSNWGGATNGSTNNFLNGTIDDFVYYARVVSTSEISQLYGPSATIVDNTPVLTGGNLVMSVGSFSGASYSWTGPFGFTSSTNVATVVGVNEFYSGVYTVTIIGTCATVTSKNFNIIGSAGAISGLTNICPTQGSVSYSVAAISNATTYNWTVPSNVSILSGQGTSNINVSFSGFAFSGALRVSASNTNSFSNTSILNFTRNSNSLNPIYPSSGLSLLYLFNGNLTDGSAGGNTGVAIGTSPVYTTDRFGNATGALSVAGTTQYITNTSTFSTIADLTLSVWIRTNTSVGGWILGRQNPGNDRKIYMNDNGTVKFGIVNGSIMNVQSLAPLNDNLWHHIVATNGAASGISIYVDGVLNGSSAAYSTDSNNGNWQIGFGTNWGGTNGSTNATFTGIIDEVSCYNRILNVNEISQLYANNFIIDNGPVCSGSNLLLRVGTLSGANYGWTGPNGFTSSSASPTISGVSAANSGNYFVTVSASGCVFSPISKSITIDGGIVNTITGSQNICTGLIPLVPLTGTATPTYLSYTYLWEVSTVSSSAGFTTATGVSTSAGYTFSTAINTNTWIRKTAFYNANCSLLSNTILITATSPIAPNFNSASTYPSGYWNAYAFGQANLNASAYAGLWSISGLSFDTRTTATGYGSIANNPSNALNYVGCLVSPSTYGLRFRAQNLVTATGIYAISIPYYDDQANLFIDGVNFFSGVCCSNANLYVGPITTSNAFEITAINMGGNGGVAYSMVLTTPGPLTNGGIISSSITNICQGGNLATSNTSFTGVTTFSGGCSVAPTGYQWQSSSDGLSWNNLPGAIYANYLYNQSILQTSYFRRQVTDLCNNSQFSNVLTISINFSGADPTVPGANVWNSYYYYDRSLNASNGSGPLAGTFTMPGLNYTTPGLSFDTRNYFSSGQSPTNAPGAQGCPITGNNISAKFLRTGFTPGSYRFDIPFIDDQVWMFVNGQLVGQQLVCCVVVNNIFTGSLTGTDIVEFRWAQGGGGSGLYVSITGPSLTVTSPIAGTVGPQAIACSNDIPTQTFSTVNSTTGGCLIKNYQWQNSTLSGTSGFGNITNATAQTLIPGFTLYATTWLRRLDTDWCGNVVTLTGALLSVTGTTPGDTSVFGNNIWRSYGFNSFTGTTAASVANIANFTSYRGYATIAGPDFTSTSLYSNSTSPSYIPGYQGCSILTTQHSTITKRTGFPAGKYHILFQHDDPGIVLINGVAVYSSAYTNGGYNVTNWIGNLGASDKIEIRQSNNNGPSSYGIQLVTTVANGLLTAGTIGSDQAVCYNSTGTVITSTSIASTAGCFVYYRWLSSTVPGLASNINTLTGLTLTAGYTIISPIVATTYFRRIALDACGGVLPSNIVTISVNGILSAGSINSLSGVCAGSSLSTITSASLPTGGVGGYGYVWQSSPDNASWTSIVTATGLNLTQPGSIASPTYFRRSVTSGSCGTANTTSVLADILPVTSIISQPVNSTVCGGFAIFTVMANGVNPTYQWQMSTATGQFFNLSGPLALVNNTSFTGVNSSVLSIAGSIVSVSGSNYRVLVNSNCGPVVTSSGAAGLFQGPPSITSQPANTSVCIGNAAVYVVVASSPILSFQWKQSTDGGATYDNIIDNATFSGSNSANLTVNGLSIGMTGFKYLSVLSTTCVTLTSNGANLTVTGTIANQSLTGNSFVCPNTSATLSGAAPLGGGGSYTYQWRVSTISGITGFVNGSGSSSTLLGYNTPNINLPSWFIRVATSSSGCQNISTTLGVGINQATSASIISPAANAVSCAGTNMVITATASGTGTLSYFWRLGSAYLANNLVYSGTNTPSLTISGISTSMVGIDFSLSVTSSVCVATVSGNRRITSLLTPVAITTNPSSSYTCQGNTLQFSANTTGSGVAYRWQVSTDGSNANFADLGNSGVYTGVNTATMQITGVPTSFSNYAYRAKVDGTCSSTQYSNFAVLSVSSAVTGNNISASQLLCYGVTPAALIGNAPPTLQGGTNNFIYNWQYSLDNTSFLDFSPSSVTSVNYAPSTLSGTTYFRRQVYSLDCAVSNSTSISINVNQPTNIVANPVTTGICQGNDVSFSVSATGLNVAYQWQYATSTAAGGNWTNIIVPNIGGVTHNNFLTPTLSILIPPITYNNNQYRTIITSQCDGGNPFTTTGATLLINPTPAFVANPLSTINFCEGQSVVVNTSATGPAAVSYQWLQSPTGSGGVFSGITASATVAGFNANSLSLPGASLAISGYAFRPIAFIGGCSITGSVIAVINGGPNSWQGNSTNWFNPSNWCSNTVPVITSNVIIPNGLANYPNISTSGAVFRNLTIAGGGSLAVANTNAITVTGNWLNNGTFTGNSSAVNFLGTASQTIGGSSNSNFYDVNISNSAGVSLINSESVRGTLTLGSSTNLSSNGNLILASDIIGTGRVSALPSGAGVSGTVTVQRYLPAKRSTRYFSSPVQNGSLTQWMANILITGPGGASNGFDAGSTLPTVIYYAENTVGSLNFGWTSVPTATSILQIGRGYQVAVRGNRSTSGLSTFATVATSATIMALTGTINQGTYALPVTYTSTPIATVDGFNLIGNPYPSQIDWNSGTGWVKTSIDNAIYIFDPFTINTNATTSPGSTFSYVSGVSSDGRINGNVIASSQGFFVKANAANPSLTINENAKVNSSHNSNFRLESESPEYFNIGILSKNGSSDYTAVRFNENATNDFDSDLDAFKIKNSAINISTQLDGKEELSINSLRFPTNEVEIPIVLDVKTGTGFHLHFTSLENIVTNISLYLKDSISNSLTEITPDLMFGFDQVTLTRNRFSIIAKNDATTSTDKSYRQLSKLTLYPNPVIGQKINLKLDSKEENIVYTIFDLLGKTYTTNVLNFVKGVSSNQVDVSDLPNGLYLFNYQINGITKTKTFIVNR